jgi:hypothetical protein
MCSDHSSFTEFLQDKDDVQLLRQSSLEIERKLVHSFCAKPTGDLLSKISSSWGLSPLLQMELFILASIIDRVMNDSLYSFTPNRRQRYILAFERCIREMERLMEPIQISIPTLAIPSVKKHATESVLESVFSKCFELICLISKQLYRQSYLPASVKPLFGRRPEYDMNLIHSNSS